MLLSEGNSCWLLWFGPNGFPMFSPLFHTMLIFQLTQAYLPKRTQNIFCLTVVGDCCKEYIQVVRLLFIWFSPSWTFCGICNSHSFLQGQQPSCCSGIPSCSSRAASLEMGECSRKLMDQLMGHSEINLRAHMLGSVRLRCQQKFTSTYMGWNQPGSLWM